MKRLHGFSGCRVELLRNGRVRKTAGEAAYSPRLRAQCARQAALAALFPAPAVLAEGWEGDLYWFEMAFVEGLNLLDAIEAWGIGIVPGFIDSVFQAMAGCTRDVRGTLAPALFTDKLHQIRAGMPAVLGERGRADVDRLVGRMLALNWKGIPATPGHGDLTLENIIVRHDGTLAFIDPLDGPLASVSLDIAKLQQDTRSFWRLRPQPGVLPAGDALDRAIMLEYLDRQFQARWAGLPPEFTDRQAQLLLFQLLRIVPYCREAEVAGFLIHRLNKGALALESQL